VRGKRDAGLGFGRELKDDGERALERVDGPTGRMEGRRERIRIFPFF
jgi:hypothetical protein